MQIVSDRQQDDFEILTNIGYWEQFHESFQLHSSHINELSEWTQSAMLTLHSQLLFDREYQDSLERAENEIIKNHNLVIPLFENNVLRVNLLAIKSGSDLPLHDHPGSLGAMVVISGQVRTIACEYATKVGNTNQSQNWLTITENKIFSSMETSCFTRDQHNIHSIKAVTNRAVLMVIHTQPFAANQQSFFFTADPQQKVGSQVLTQRVRAQAFQRFRQNRQLNIKGIVK